MISNQRSKWRCFFDFISGVYNENQPIKITSIPGASEKNKIVIQSHSRRKGDVSLVFVTNFGFYLNRAAFVSIENFTLEASGNSVNILNNSNNFVISGCLIHSNSTLEDGIKIEDAFQIQIKENKIEKGRME